MLVYLIVIVIFITVLLTVSSRIRKAASRAFDREEIETDEFFIVKPEGLLHPIGKESEFAFEAYSKVFGKGDAEEIRLAEITVRTDSEREFSDTCNETRKTVGVILSEETSENSCVIKTEETIQNAVAYNFYKIIRDNLHQKTYVLKISVLKEFLDDREKDVNETLESFRLK
jgi:hypothetical protein